MAKKTPCLGHAIFGQVYVDQLALSYGWNKKSLYHSSDFEYELFLVDNK